MFSNIAQISNRCLLSNVRFDKLQFRLRRSFIRRNERQKVSPTPPEIKFESQPIRAKNLWKPLVFTIVFSEITFAGAAIWEYERMMKNGYHFMRFPLKRQETLEWRRTLRVWWANLTEGEKLFAGICFLNVVIYACWKVPALQSTMYRYFCANPGSRATCWPLLLSTFSHNTLPHLVANMYVLYTFSKTAVASLGTEQFLALYLTSGVVSSFASHLLKTAMGSAAFSLGASGAIFGVVAYVCTQFPEARLSIVLIPGLTFSAGTGLKALIALDVMGCIMRWRYFDHAAHLGGALFGIFWQAWGNANIWQKRGVFENYWHRLRHPPTNR